MTMNVMDERTENTMSFRHNHTRHKKNFMGQPWTNTGFQIHDNYAASTTISKSDKEEMLTQICSIFEKRLCEVVTSRQKGQNLERQPTDLSTDNQNNREDESTLLKPSYKQMPPLSCDNCILSTCTREQIRKYVMRIRSLYRKVHYHNFEHAHHVTLSVNKILAMLFDSKDEYDDSDDISDLDSLLSNPTILTSSFSTRSSSSTRSSISTSVSSFVSRSSSKCTRNSFNGRTSVSERPSLIIDRPMHSKGSSNMSCASTVTMNDGLSFTSRSSLGTKVEGDNGPEIVKEYQSKRSYSDLCKNKVSTKVDEMDAIIKFAAVFGALIHDVDHTGVPNMQLVKEECDLAKKYNNKSIAENHSLNLALDIMMEPDFTELRNILVSSPEDKLKFRKTVHDVLLCTDIASPEQAKLTKVKWREVFGPSAPEEQLWTPCNIFRRHSMDSLFAVRPKSKEIAKEEYQPMMIGTLVFPVVLMKHDKEDDDVKTPEKEGKSNDRWQEGDDAKTSDNRGKGNDRWLGKKRTLNVNGDLIEFYQKSDEDGGFDRLKSSVIMETIMNAADIAHTMQGWEIFLKWNSKLFEEIYDAHINGRGADPCENWFAGQIGFFDAYVLPLARRLARCGDFGEEGKDIFLSNAQENRRKWLVRGNEITKDMVTKAKATYTKR